MLQAQTPEGELITLANLMPNELKQLKLDKKNFTCPACGRKVIMKAGTKVVPHFAHHASSCVASESGEGLYHEKGKLLLYKWLQAQKLNVKLEAYLPKIQQRPDILLTVGTKKIAIEYQCARIPPNLIYKRNKGYEQKGITPLWIMGEQLLKRMSTYHYKVDTFLKLFIHQYSNTAPLILYFFCPYSHQLIKLMDLYSIGNGQVYGMLQVHKLRQTPFLELFQFKNLETKRLWKLWQKEKKRFRLRPIKKYGSDIKWHKWLYDRGIHRDHLPSIVHLPIPSQHFLKQPLWQWQSKLVIQILDPLPIGSSLPLSSITFSVHRHYPQENFPLIKHHLNPVEEYMQLLCHLGYFIEDIPKQYKKIKSIPCFSTLEEAIKADNELVLQFLK